MRTTTYHEAMERGTPDFPAELYHLDFSHPRYQMCTHWHREFELMRVISGKFTLYLNEAEYVLGSGDSVLVPGGIVHGAQAENCVYECIVFSPGLMYVSAQCRSLVKGFAGQCYFYKDNKIMDKIFEALGKKEKGFQFEFLSGIYMLIADIAKNKSESAHHTVKNEKYEKIKSALMLIEENYASHFTLSELAASCGMSPNYFCRFFKEMTQKTPFDYINIYRINVACEMIAAGQRNITEVAFACGFNDLSYFIKIFKRYKGVSPKAYLKVTEIC